MPPFLQTLISFRQLAAAVILATVISGVFIFNVARDANRIYFEIGIASSVGGMVQVFYDRGEGFREDDSVRTTLRSSETPATYRFRMPSASTTSLRLDPNAAGGTYVLSSPRFVNGRGKELRSLPLASFKPFQDIASFANENNQLRLAVAAEKIDPAVIVILDPPLRPWFADWKNSGFDIVRAVSGVAFSWVAVFALMLVATQISRNAARLSFSFMAWARSSPRKAIILVSVISVTLSCYPVVFFGKSFVSPNDGATAQLYPNPPYLPGDTDATFKDTRGSDVGAMMWAFRPYSVIQNRAISDGELPLWNPYSSAGTPLLAQGISMIGDPLHWITIATNGSAWSWDVKFLIAKFLLCAGVGFLVFMTTGALTPAVVLASSSAFLGFFIYRFNHPAFFSVCYAPLILIAWGGLLRTTSLRESRPFILLLVLSILMELNSGTAKEAYTLIIFLNATGALALVLQRWSWKDRLIKLAWASSIGLGTILLLAPFWLVFQDELQRAYTLSNVPSARPFSFHLLAGFFDEIFYTQATPGRGVMGPAANLLIGVAILWGIICAPRLRREPWFVACFIGGMLSVSIAFGVISPSLIKVIPIIKNVGHVGNTFSCVLLVQGLVVAGFGIREFQKQALSDDWRHSCLRLVLLVFLIAASYAGQIPAQQKWPVSAIIVAVVPLIACFVMIVVSRMVFSGNVTARNVGILCFCLMAIHFRFGQQLETGTAELDWYVANPRQRPDFSIRSPALEWLPSMNASPYRVVGIDRALFPGYQASLGHDGINGPDAVINPYFRQLVNLFKFEMVWGWLTTISPSQVQRLSKALDVLNVRYLLFPDATKIPSNSQVVARNDLAVVERPTAWPRAYFDDTLLVYRDLNDLGGLFAKSHNPIAAVQSGDEKAPSPMAGDNIIVAATDYRVTANSIAFSIDAPKRGVVVLGEAFVERSFIATLNGKDVDWFRVNHAFKGVVIPGPGRFVVSFTYRPPLLNVSLFLSSIGAALLFILLLVSSVKFPIRLKSRDRRAGMVEQIQ